MKRILTTILLLTAVGCGPPQLEGVFPVRMTRAAWRGTCDGIGPSYTTSLQFIDGDMQPMKGDDATCSTSYAEVNNGIGNVEVICFRSPGGFDLTELDLFVRTKENKLNIDTGMVVSTGDIGGCTRLSYTLLAL